MGLPAIVLCALWAGASQTEPPAKAPDCVPPEPAIFQERAAAETFSRQSLDDALTARKLVRVRTGVTPVPKSHKGPWAPGTVFSVDGRQAILGPWPPTGPGRPVDPPVRTSKKEPPPFVFVTDARGDLFHLDAKPDPGSRKQYTLCGCGPPTVDAMPTHRPRLAFLLPPGKKIQGVVKVEYRSRVVEIRWLPPGGRPCPPPP